MVVGVGMVERRSWWTPVIPIATMALWYFVIMLGEDLLGWSA